MIKRFSTIMMLLAASILSVAAWSHDAELAASYDQLFAPAVGADAGKALHLIMPSVLVEKIQANEPMILLDVRTPGETRIFTVALPGSLTIPLNELFRPENLERIPTDKPVMVICQSGARAVAAAMALRHIGFDRVFVVKGGFRALSEYLDAKTANQPAKAKAKSAP